MTATLIARLADDGLLLLDDPVSRRLPLPGAAGSCLDVIRIRHLLTHTSGLPSLPWRWIFQGKMVLPDPYADVKRSDVDAYLATCSVAEPLPQPFAYSNLGFAVLGRVVEATLSQPYVDAVSSRILRPSGLQRATSR